MKIFIHLVFCLFALSFKSYGLEVSKKNDVFIKRQQFEPYKKAFDFCFEQACAESGYHSYINILQQIYDRVRSMPTFQDMPESAAKTAAINAASDEVINDEFDRLYINAVNRLNGSVGGAAAIDAILAAANDETETAPRSPTSETNGVPYLLQAIRNPAVVEHMRQLKYVPGQRQPGPGAQPVYPTLIEQQLLRNDRPRRQVDMDIPDQQPVAALAQQLPSIIDRATTWILKNKKIVGGTLVAAIIAEWHWLYTQCPDDKDFFDWLWENKTNQKVFAVSGLTAAEVVGLILLIMTPAK